ncbi:cytochrome c oxidase subunit II transmembrane domain-containing protein, partial [Chitinimonas sp.]|uniref:cytochrome c oxidase subunit II transmembrane domain-containing protein n=1 Tax=Chitinimonas sp. TaxID=1934313 RepID=UPI0035B4ACB3
MKNRASWLTAALSLVTSLSSFADYQLNFQTPATKLAGEIYDLHTYLLIVCVVIFVVVFGAMFYSIFKHRKSVGHKAANFHESTTVELIWTIIPVLILAAMAYPATKVVLAQKDTRGADLTIKVTGYQWKWGYDYIDEGISFHSRLATPQTQYEEFDGKGEAKNANYLLEVDNPVVVPVGKKVRILTTANAVIHSWGVPAFGVKQ